MAITFNYNDKLYINGDNVGIGTDSPSVPLTVVAESGGTAVRLLGRAGDGYAFTTFRNNADSATNGEIGISDAQNMLFYTGASERMRITSGGNVGIGTNDPTDYGTSANTLEVRGASGTGAGLIRVSNAGNTVGAAFYSGSTSSTLGVQTAHPLNLNTNNSTKMTILSNGNVGIGTTAPANILHIEGDATTTALITTPANSGVSQLRVAIDRGLQGGIDIIADEDNGIAKIVTNNSSKWPLTFLVRGDDGTNERMRITDTGNVGIGTTSPQAKLHVNAGAVSTPRGGGFTKFFFTGDNASTTYFELQTPTGSTGDILFSDSSGGDYGIIGYNHANDSMYFYTNSNSRMHITSTGNVGIGTDSPAGKLHVYSGASGGGYNSDYDELVLSNSGRAGINILSSATEYAAIIMGGKVDNSTGGIYHNAANNMLSLATQDAFRLNIDNTGNVGIGTSSPAQKLEVAGITRLTDTNANPLELNRGLDVDSVGAAGVGMSFGTLKTGVYKTGAYIFSVLESNGEDGTFGIQTRVGDALTTKMSITSSGNVGIGTTSPTSKLHVSNGFIRVDASANAQGIEIYGRSSDNIGELNFRTNSGAFLGRVDGRGDGLGIWSSTNLPINFKPGNTGTKVVFDNSGDVGIGTTSPNAKLEVNVASGDGILIKSDDVATIKMKGSGGVYDWGLATTKLAAHDFGIYKSNAAGGDPISAGTVQLYFKETGSTTTNVGIGTRNPSEKLEVDGNIAADGFLGSPETTAADTGSGYASYDVLTGKTGAGLYQVSIMANPNSAGSSAYKDILYGKVIIGTGWDGSNITHYIHYVQENPDPRGMYTSGGGNLTVEAFFVTGGTESTSILNNTTYTVRIKISGYTVAGSGTIVRTQKIV